MLKGRNKKDGITLVALIVTIVILLILATVTVIEVKETGLFEKAKTAAREYKNAQEKEQEQIKKVDDLTRIEVINDLQIGDYVKYNIAYTDAHKTGTHFTEENGWRVISPGNKYNDNTYDNVEIIPTGIPMRLYYSATRTEIYPWEGRAEDMEKFESTCGYVAKDGLSSGLRAASGLKYRFDKVNILESDPGGNWSSNVGGYVTGDGYRVKILKVTETGNEEIKGDKGIAELLVLPEVAKGVRCPDLEIVKKTMNLRRTPGGRVFITDRSTDEDVLQTSEKDNRVFTTKDDAAKGFWNLQDLEIGQYQKEQNNPAWWYWLASTYSPNGNGLRVLGYSDADGCIAGNYNGNNGGLRPIITLNDGIKIEKSSFQGN